MKTDRFVIIDVLTGAMDGVYFDMKSADEAMQSLHNQWPQLHWLLVKVEKSLIPDGYSWVPDCAFHVNVLDMKAIEFAGSQTGWP